MRKDAEQNRARVLDAAKELMREMGGDAPLEAIAERAGVSRPTLYRNFADRQTMYEAVLARDLELMTAAIADETDPLAFLRHTAELMRVYDKFLASLVDMPDYDAAKNQAYMASVLAAPLAEAQRQGVLDRGLTPDDVLVACRMLASHWKLDDEPDFAAVFERRFALLTHGLLPPRRRARPKVEVAAVAT